MIKKIIVCITTLYCALIQAQTPWVYSNSSNFSYQALESYDGGTICTGSIYVDGLSNIGIIFKLDKAGNTIWTHSVDDDINIASSMLDEDSEGNIVIGGHFHDENTMSFSDAFLMKLNACGEFVWFNHLEHSAGNNYIKGLEIDSNNNIVTIEYINAFQPEIYKETTLRKYTPEGEMIWESILLPEQSSVPNSLVQTSDGGWLTCGFYYAPPYYDQESSWVYTRATTVKTDSLGNIEWVNIYKWEEDTEEQKYVANGMYALELPNNEYIVLGMDKSSSFLPPFLFKINNQGETIWTKDVSEPMTAYSNGVLQITNDNHIIMAQNILPDPLNDAYNQHAEIFKYDIEGTQVGHWINHQQVQLIKDINWDSDSSSLHIVHFNKRDADFWPNFYAYKFDPYSMELDTFIIDDNSIYDYYCPETIEDSFIDIPGLSIKDEMSDNHTVLKISPNPAKEFIHIEYNIKDSFKSAKYEIRNIDGRLVSTGLLKSAVGKINANISSLSSGVYIVSILIDEKLIANSKVIVE